MAGFGDNNDIKINVTLDTEAAIKAAQELKTAIESSLKATEEQFNKIQGVAKQLSGVLEKLSKAEIAGSKDKAAKIIADADQAAKKEIAIAEDTANKKAKAAQKAANLALEAEKTRVRDMEALARREAEQEKTRRTQLLKDIAELNVKRAVVRKTPRAELPADLGGASGAGKLLDALGKSAAGIGVQFGNVNVVVGTLLRNLVALGGPIGVTTAGFAVLKFGLDKFNASIDETAQAAGKLEGLKTGFETLQRSIGQAPLASINKLREATQGLISDTDLYQRANQAVLLGVPTDTFNQAAAAAVKLGRAMGIDASFGLESLSLGLGRQSRLYLDNLGIVVSAEEAYRNFGLTVGKSAADLTDAEKKAAFFAEALKKIKERADELPDPIDSVAIAQSKANVAQQNVNQLYLEGFNASQNLAEQYAIQKANTEVAAKSAEIYGAALAELGALAKGLANGFKTVGVVVSTGFAQALDETFKFLGIGLSKESKIAILNDDIAETRERIEYLKTTIPATGELGLIARGNKEQIDKLNESLDKDQKALDLLKGTLNELDGKNVNIKLAIEGIETAQSQIATVFADLGKKAEQEAGVFKIAGLPDAEAAQIFSSYQKAKEEFDNSLNKTEALEKYKAALKDIEQQVAGGAIKTAAKDLASDVSNLATALSSGDLGSAKNIFGDIAKGVVNVSKATRSTNLSLKDLEAGLNGVNGQIKKNATTNKNAAKQFASELKKQERELQQFTRGIARALEKAIPSDVQKDLVDIFNDPTNDAKKLADKIEELGKKFLKAGGDVQAFIKEAAALKDLKDKIPNRPLQGSAENTNAIDDYNEKLRQAQQGTINLRDLIYGKQTDAGGKLKGGGFFGFDLGLNDQTESALAGEVQNFLGTALQAGVDGFARDDIPQIASGLGALIGGGLAAYFSEGDPNITAAGAQAGAFIGNAFSSVLEPFGKDIKGTRQRKAIDEYFATLFDEGRLAVVIQGQLTGAIDEATGAAIRDAQPSIARISDLVFEGLTPFAGRVAFGGEGFTNYFDTLSSDIQASFSGVGIALGVLQGISAEQARLIGVALTNNIGGSLQNLQVLVQQTGESFDDMAAAVLKSFRDAQLTIEEAYNALVQLQNIYEVGIPGAVGAYEEAIKNLNNILKSDRPGQYAIDSLRDIGAEGAEAKKTFESVIASLAGTFQFTAEQQVRLFEALRINGITSLAQLQAASDEQLLAILRNIQLIRDNAQAPLVTTPVVTTAPKTSGPSGPKKKTPQEIAAELLAKQKEEAIKLLKESQKYLDITDQINKGLADQLTAGRQLKDYQKQILDAIIRRDKIEGKLNEELNKGSKGNAKRIAQYSAELAKVEEFLKGISEKAAAATRQFKQLNLAGVIPFIKSANMLGVVATQVGVDLQKSTDILIKGFLQGRMTLADLNKELDRTKETLGPGIPNAVGAVTEAFQGLIDAGVQGGQFSVDAFRDIFAEFREKFQKEGSALREAERKQLEANLKTAREVLANAVGPEATTAAKKTLDEAKKALDDFWAAIPAPDLADLRNQLNQVFGEEQINKFFQALDESGLRSFDELEKAGTDSIVAILGKLQSLGFNFGDTSQAILDAQQKLREGEQEANAGLDPLQEAINLIKGLNDGAAQLPPVFNNTTAAIESLNGPLAALSSGFDDILEKLSRLSGQTFENDVIFNVRTVGEGGAKALVDVIFGDGTGTTSDVGGTTSGGGGSTDNTARIARINKEIKRLQGKRSTQAIRNRLATLRRRLAELGG